VDEFGYAGHEEAIRRLCGESGTSLGWRFWRGFVMREVLFFDGTAYAICKPIGGKMEKVMKCGDVASHLELSEATIQKWVRRGIIPCRKFGNRVIFLVEELEWWIGSGSPDVKKR
jgi:hypothetical protein